MAMPNYPHDAMTEVQVNTQFIKDSLLEILTAIEDGPEGPYLEVSKTIKDIYDALETLKQSQANASYTHGLRDVVKDLVDKAEAAVARDAVSNAGRAALARRAQE